MLTNDKKEELREKQKAKSIAFKGENDIHLLTGNLAANRTHAITFQLFLKRSC
jgi:hypothetical protein